MPTNPYNLIKTGIQELNKFAFLLRTGVVQNSDGNRVTSVLKSTPLYSQGQLADSVYLIEDGLIKLTRTNRSGERIIIQICGPNHLVGDEALSGDLQDYYAGAETLTPVTVYRFSRDVVKDSLSAHLALTEALLSYLATSKNSLAHKVELLCLHDVEYRVLWYLAELANLVKASPDGAGYQLPITQLELADLIGATRETTSTTLNQLERRGLVKLSRRLMTVCAPATLRAAAQQSLSKGNSQSAAG